MCEPSRSLAGAVGGNNAYAGSPADRAVRDVFPVVRAAQEAGASLSSILTDVANGLTGKVSGYTERALARAMVAAAEGVLETHPDVLKADERGGQGDASTPFFVSYGADRALSEAARTGRPINIAGAVYRKVNHGVSE